MGFFLLHSAQVMCYQGQLWVEFIILGSCKDGLENIGGMKEYLSFF